MANTTITPSAGLVRLTSNFVVTPLVAAVALAGAVPGVSNEMLPPTVALTLSTSAPQLALGIGSGGTAALALGGITPTLSFGQAVAPATGAVGFSSSPVSLVLGTLQPGTASVAFLGNAPTLSIPNISITPLNAISVFIGQTPALSGIQPITSGSITLSGSAVTLDFGLGLTPAGTGGIQINGVSGTLGLTIAPANGQLTVTQYAALQVTPSAGVLTLTGNIANVGAPGSVSPGTAALSLIGTQPIQLLMVPAPPTANLVFGGGIPALTLTHIQVTSAGAISLTGNVGAVVQSQILAPSNGAITLGTAAVTRDVNLLGSPAGLQLTGVAPIPSISSVLTPTVGALAFAGNVPAGIPGGSIAPSSGSVVVTGATPALSPGLVPLSATMSLNSDAAALNLQVAPVANALALTGAAPTVNGKTIIALQSASLALNTQSPVLSNGPAVLIGSLTYASSAPTVDLGMAPAGSSVSLVSSAPALSITGVPQTQAGGVSLVGGAPTLGLTIAPNRVTMTLAGVQPVVNSLTTLPTLTGTVTFGSDPSDVIQLGVILPDTALLALLADPPQLVRTGFIAPPTASISLASDVPLVQATTAGYVAPGTAMVTLTGQPAVIPLYNPDPYHTVQSPGPDRYTVISPG